MKVTRTTTNKMANEWQRNPASLGGGTRVAVWFNDNFQHFMPIDQAIDGVSSGRLYVITSGAVGLLDDNGCYIN